MLAVTLSLLVFATMTVAAIRVGAEPRERTVTEPGDLGAYQRARPTTSSGSVTVGLYRHHSAAYWAGRFRARTRQLQRTRVLLARRWHPTVDYALRLASAVAGVSYWQLREVSWCESRHDPFATNGHYRGIFQLGWSPFGMSPFDPVANALSAALTVRHDGSWRQWTCKP